MSISIYACMNFIPVISQPAISLPSTLRFRTFRISRYPSLRLPMPFQASPGRRASAGDLLRLFRPLRDISGPHPWDLGFLLRGILGIVKSGGRFSVMPGTCFPRPESSMDSCTRCKNKYYDGILYKNFDG